MIKLCVKYASGIVCFGRYSVQALPFVATVAIVAFVVIANRKKNGDFIPSN